jgi:parvulin-like peptidyl-prolyl isomerase
MEFLLQDAVLLADPDEAELRRLFDRDGPRYRNAARLSFTQVFFASEIDARRALAALETEPIDESGEPTLLARDYESSDEQTIADLFGREFAEGLFGLEADGWRGPFRSAYGFHLVRVTKRQAATVLPFEEARERIRADWIRDREADAEDLLLRSLLEKYELIVEEGLEPWLGPLASAGR